VLAVPAGDLRAWAEADPGLRVTGELRPDAIRVLLSSVALGRSGATARP